MLDRIIRLLTEHYPDKLPRTDLTPFELGQRVGRQDIIRHLKQIEKDQEME